MCACTVDFGMSRSKCDLRNTITFAVDSSRGTLRLQCVLNVPGFAKLEERLACSASGPAAMDAIIGKRGSQSGSKRPRAVAAVFMMCADSC